jgi:hypothetical protein
MGGGMHFGGGHFGGMGGPHIGAGFAGPRASFAAVRPGFSPIGRPGFSPAFGPRFHNLAFHHNHFFFHRHHRFFAFGAPFIYAASYDSCWRRVWTAYGPQWVNVCDYGYDYGY